MYIVTFTRSTPDTTAKVEVGRDGGVTWGDAVTVVNPWDEYALEEAIVQAKNAGGKAAVIAVGSELHNEALKHSLAMGLDEAYRIDLADPFDALAYATAAAAAVKKLDDARLVLFGKESVDAGTDQHITMTARKLGWTALTSVAKILEIDYAANTIKVEKVLEGVKQVVTSALPAVVSVLKDINEPRYPSFVGIRKASKAVIPVWTPADLGVAPGGGKVANAVYRNLPARNVQVAMIEGTPEEQARQLVDKLLEEKVL